MLYSPMVRLCNSCNEYKELIDFYKCKSRLDGLKPKCKQCYNQLVSKWKSTNPDKVKKITNKSKLKRKQLDRELTKEWKLKNKEKCKLHFKKWYSNNTHKILEIGARKRAHLKKAAIGYSLFRLQLIEIYEHCPEGFHVDHIIPLKGMNVCGLHVPWNLQYLTATENLKKGNKYGTDIKIDP